MTEVLVKPTHSPVLLPRRVALKRLACGFGSLALAGLLGQKALAAANPLAPKPPRFRPRARRVIFLFMQGGPSQIDTFDYKPRLERDDGKKLPFDDARTIANSGNRGTDQRVMKSPWKFRQHGQCGCWASELFPCVARHVDDLCFIHSLHTEGVAHGPATLFLHFGDNTANPRWDQHSNLPKHADHARAVDKPIAGLLTDLKSRGLLDDTLVWWGGEFGRTPYAEKNGTGRDHNPGGFTVWLAGGGVRPGFALGATDDFGHKAVADKVHMHDLHATILHLLGLDHEKLTYRYDGRDFRLTDVQGHVVMEVLA